MQKLLTVIGDFLFPPSADQLILRNSDPTNWPALFQPGRFGAVSYLAHYQQPLVKAAVRENKFQHNRLAAQLLGTILSRWSVTQEETALFLPIPLGPNRQRTRGHNQVLTILQAAGLSEKVRTDLLKRNTETQPQSHLTKRERLSNMTGVFSFTGAADVFQSYTRVVLVDDVVTTGATLRAAQAALTPHLPAQVTLTCVALAH